MLKACTGVENTRWLEGAYEYWYGDGTINRPHSVQTKFYIKY